MKTTIKDIANIANVSPTAVSMVINKRKGVGKETRSKILKIAEELNYIPNAAARSLIKKQSRTIGLIITDIADPFYPELAKSIVDKANACGYNIILCHTGGNVDSERRSVISLMSHGVDGIIFSSVLCDDPNLDILLEAGFPFVLVNRMPINHPEESKFDYVIVDNYRGGFMAIEHLYRMGHENIAILAGLTQASTLKFRADGAVDALKHYGIKFNKRYFSQCEYSVEKVFKATQKIMACRTRPTALFIWTDTMALPARDAVESLGMKVPEDVAIVGFDNIDVSGIKGIELTTISQKKYDMGTHATEILVNKIEEKTPGMVNKIVLNAELVVRKTCGYSVSGYVR